MKLQAKTRLQAWILNTLPEKRSWATWVRLELFPDAEDLIKGVTGIAVGHLNGYTIHHVPARHSYYLVDHFASQLVLAFGYMPRSKILQEDLIAVNPKYQGNGLAFFFYEWLLKQNRTLLSDNNLSAGAAKLWMRLVEKYGGHLVVPVGTGYKTVQIQGFKQFRGVWWPVVEREGQDVVLPEIEPSKAERQAIRLCRYQIAL